MKMNFIAPETRQIIAHSLSCGKNVGHFASPGRGDRTGAFLRRFFLPPLAGLLPVYFLNPRLSPWAAVFRRPAAVISYLKATGLTLGLLINFNVSILKNGIQGVVYSSNNADSWRLSF
jgi:hypothetical protein